jgi:hypothetical protein
MVSDSDLLLSYYIGLDLGQSQDYTALAVIEEPVWVGRVSERYLGNRPGGWISPAELHPDIYWRILEDVEEYGRPPNPPLYVRHLERLPLGTRYSRVIERVLEIAQARPLADKPSCLIIDRGGVGASVVDSFVYAGLTPVSVAIHGGDAVTVDPDRWDIRVPKRDLVSAAQVLLQNRCLRIAEGLREAETLKRELLNFRVKIDPRTAHDSYSHWREDEHDDLVLATALACWFREWWNARWEEHYSREEASRMVG